MMDWDVNFERYKEYLRQAERDQLARQVMKGRRAAPRTMKAVRYAILARLGKLLVAAGRRLDTGPVSAP